nr:probable 20S rRNA accumulation protein 4 [Ipomoea batatas]
MKGVRLYFSLRGDKKMVEVILGMPGPWADDIYEVADHYTTKIGGLPDWPVSVSMIRSHLLECSACKSNLCLLAQVYAPISSKSASIEERVIYIFGCVAPKCGSSPVSWRAIRVQKSVSGEGSKPPSDESAHAPAPSVSTTNNDWKKDLWTFDSTKEEDNESNDDIDLEDLSRAFSEAASLASQSKKQIHNHECDAKPSPLGHTARVIDEKIPVLPCFYIHAEEEKFSKESSSACSKDTLLSIKEQNADSDHSKDEMWEEESYEYDRAPNADRIYLKFKKRMDSYPQQCFRYSYGGKTLLASAEHSDPGMCRLCGGSRHYEMQLMPPLLYFLHEATSNQLRQSLENWNWMTLIIYTCSESCSNYSSEENCGKDGWIVVEEAIVVQYE